MQQYEPPQKTMEIDVPVQQPHKYRVNKNKLFVAIGLLCFIAAASAIAIHLVSGKPVNVAATAVENTPDATMEAEKSAVLTGKVIVVDAGHGGFDPGTIGVQDSHEDELNLSVAQFLKTELESYGAQVIMTRSDDDALAETKEADMAERRRIITESDSDIVVSIHMNSFSDSSVSGPLVIFMQGSTKGEKLAKGIQQSLIDILDPPNENSARSGDLYILRSGWQPCVIVECGYLSNEKEEQQLLQSDYQQKVASAICDGVSQYFSSDNE